MNYKRKYFPRVKKKVERNVFAAILRLFLELLISKWLTSNNFISIYSMKICVNMLHNFFIHLFAAHLMKSHRDIMYQYIQMRKCTHLGRQSITKYFYSQDVMRVERYCIFIAVIILLQLHAMRIVNIFFMLCIFSQQCNHHFRHYFNELMTFLIVALSR